MLIIDLVLDVLATARLTRLVVEDAITEPLRDRIEGKYPGSQVSYLVSCTACTSVWAAGAVAVSPRKVVRMLALSEATIMVKGLLDG